jgi:hypothetical protein
MFAKLRDMGVIRLGARVESIKGTGYVVIRSDGKSKHLIKSWLPSQFNGKAESDLPGI